MEKRERARILNALFFTIIYLMICWTLFLSDEWLGTDFKHQFGMRPRTVEGIWGIIGHAFLHGSYEHIWQNTTAFAVLNTFLFYFYREIALKVFIVVFFGTGIMLWIWGGPGNHIGASGVIYGLAAFLFFSGIFRDNEQLLRVALVVAFAYGSIFWYVFPIDPKISWEGHLSGAIIGVAFAYYYRGEGPKRKKYNWEIEEEMEREMEEKVKESEEFINANSTEDYFVTYSYKPTPKKKDERQGGSNKKPPENSEG